MAAERLHGDHDRPGPGHGQDRHGASSPSAYSIHFFAAAPLPVSRDR
jgi:hypothetical protein